MGAVLPRSPGLDATGALEHYLREIRRFPVLSAEEERELARTCRRALVTANLRFVVRIAREYRSSGLRLADLVQEGNLGLMRAVEKFDPDRGVRLVTYASWWIRAHIQSFIMRSHSLVKLGTTAAQRRLFSSLAAARHELEGAAGPEGDGRGGPGPEAIARRLSVRPAEVEEMTSRLAARDLSLDAPGEGAEALGPALAADAPPQDHAVAEAQAQRLMREHVARALVALEARERFVIEQRVMSDEPATLREVGQQLGVSRERVRQIEQRARHKLEAELHGLAAELAWPVPARPPPSAEA